MSGVSADRHGDSFIDAKPRAARPCENPFRVARLDALAFVDHAVRVDAVMEALGRHQMRGSLVGPHGSGKSTLLRAVGERLIERGLSPMPLFMNREEAGTFPARWRVALRRAGPGDALLLDGYDLLPRWARGRVRVGSRSAGALVVTAHRRGTLPKVASTGTSPALLHRLVTTLAGRDTASQIDCVALWQRYHGNLRDALRDLYDRAATAAP